MSRLTATTVVLNPISGDIETLAEGSLLPEWAAGLVGDHILTESDDTEAVYESLMVEQLRREIAGRNAGRDESAHVVSDGARKADLIAALIADDNR